MKTQNLNAFHSRVIDLEAVSMSVSRTAQRGLEENYFRIMVLTGVEERVTWPPQALDMNNLKYL